MAAVKRGVDRRGASLQWRPTAAQELEHLCGWQASKALLWTPTLTRHGCSLHATSPRSVLQCHSTNAATRPRSRGYRRCVPPPPARPMALANIRAAALAPPAADDAARLLTLAPPLLP